MKHFFDLLMSVMLLLLLFLPMLLIAIVIFSTSKGSVLYWSDRVGKNGKIFKMPNFEPKI